MVCVHCGGKTAVINSSRQQRSNQVWRRRQCHDCGAIFTTTEGADHGATWLVRDKRGLQPFSRDKLFLSLQRSCQHRRQSVEDAAALTDTIIKKLPQHLSNGAIDRQDIVNLAEVTLNRFDTAASVHYRAFHHR